MREESREKFERDIYSLKDMYTLREITTTHAQSIKELRFLHYYLFLDFLKENLWRKDYQCFLPHCSFA